MAVDMFLKLGTYEGESKDGSHGKEIDVLAWSWGMSQSGTTHSGSGGGSGKVSVQDISITKYVDKSTPNILKACCTGTHISEATLVVRKAGGTPVEYIKIKMEEVLISSVSTGGSGGEDRLTENVTLNFGKFEYTYTTQKDTGEKDAEIPIKWNIAKNAES